MTRPPGGDGGQAPDRLRDELQQTRPFRSSGQVAFLSLLRTADQARHRFSRLVEAEGVTQQQYNVLRILRGAGQVGLPTLEIGDRMIQHTPGVTRIVDRLVARGLVKRERDTEDRRRVWCRISPEGLAVLARLDEPVDRHDEALFASLSTDELEQLIRLLDNVRGHITDPE